MICGATRKTIFKSHKAALIRGGEILTSGNNRRTTPREFSAYWCVYCGFYHLAGKQGGYRTNQEHNKYVNDPSTR